MVHGEQLSEQARNQTVRLYKDVGVSTIISRLLNRSQNTVAAVVRRYRRTHTPEGAVAILEKIKAHTTCYLCNLALENRLASPSDLEQGVSVEIGV